MKKLLLLLCVLSLHSCINQNVEDIAAYEFDNAWYWVAQYKEGASQEDIHNYVSHNTNPKQTSYFFIFSSDVDISIFKEKPFNQRTFAAKMVEMQPAHAYYKMPNDPKLYDDGLWLMEQSIE